jgi:serine phosphatase RsbU (regulator of sigma subunit)
MNAASSPRSPIIEWGWAGRALEDVSGDLHVVVQFDDGAVVVLLDGLGHGHEAAQAARAAAPVIEAHAREPVLQILQHCHEALYKTRGAAMSIASFDARDDSMNWAGVGNVDGILVRAQQNSQVRDEAISTRGGVVGYRLPPLRAERLSLSRGDTLVMATDGIQSTFTARMPIAFTPQELAETILMRYGKPTDDAHVVVARYLGAHA